MRTAFLSSMFFALMVGITGVAHATPAAGAVEPVVAMQVMSDAKVVTININTADEATLQGADSEDKSIVIFATLVGALVLARGAESDALKHKIFDVTRSALKQSVPPA